MNKSTYTARYRLPTGGISLPDNPVDSYSSDGKRLLTLVQNEIGAVRLTIKLTDVPEVKGRDIADELANRFVEVLVVELASLIFHAGPIEFESSSFSDGSSAETMLDSLRLNCSAVVTTRVDKNRVEDVLRSTLMAPASQIPASRTIRVMYCSALRMRDPVVRYLMLYSVLLLVAEISTGEAVQREVDAMLLKEESTLQLFPDPRKPGSCETELTKARNDFIHAESVSRGQDAEKAANEVRRLVGRMTSLTGSIVAKV